MSRYVSQKEAMEIAQEMMRAVIDLRQRVAILVARTDAHADELRRLAQMINGPLPKKHR